MKSVVWLEAKSIEASTQDIKPTTAVSLELKLAKQKFKDKDISVHF